ncbi:MAG: entericidin A/B family lipoprotein [Pseudomonadota bacterium]|nr:entericidin A/B family lipoprotein [Pseudomonadota bacterium]
MNTTALKSITAALALAGLTLTTAACNTVKGVGEDVESVGRAGERAID